MEEYKMARVKMTLTCKCCGELFEHIHFCRNSSEAASYEEWAKDSVTVCHDCYRAAKNAKQTEKLNAYMDDLEDKGHKLPEIIGVSDKQIAYAASLRRQFVLEYLLKYNVNVDRFLSMAKKLHPENISADARTKLEAAAAAAKQPFADWFAGYRAEHLRRTAHLLDATDAAKIETVFNESNASKIIDTLR